MFCYIMQDDCFSPVSPIITTSSISEAHSLTLTIDVSQHLTVEEAMKVAADLKLGERMTQGEKDIVSINIICYIMYLALEKL